MNRRRRFDQQLRSLPRSQRPAAQRRPVSEVEQVKVRFDEKATIPAARPDADGFVDWRLTLPGGGHQTLKLCYVIAKRKDVQG